MSIDLIVQIGTLLLVGYVGWHLRREIRTLKGAVDAQKATIDAQVKPREDFEALNRTMKQTVETMEKVIAFVNPKAQLEREQAFQARLERDMDHHLQEMKSLLAQEMKSFLAGMGEVMGEVRRRLAETKSALAVITRERREHLEELKEMERQLTIETESPQDS